MAAFLIITALDGDDGSSESESYEILNVIASSPDLETGEVLIRKVGSGEQYRLIQEPLFDPFADDASED